MNSLTQFISSANGIALLLMVVLLLNWEKMIRGKRKRTSKSRRRKSKRTSSR